MARSEDGESANSSKNRDSDDNATSEVYVRSRPAPPYDFSWSAENPFLPLKVARIGGDLCSIVYRNPRIVADLCWILEEKP